MSRMNPISAEEFGTYTPQQQNEHLFLKLLDVEENNKQALQGIQSGGTNLEERVLGMAETLGGMSSRVQEMTMAFEHLSGEWAIQDSTVAVTLEALAKAAEDLRGAREEACNNPQMVTAGMGSGTVRITTKQPRVAALLVFNGDAEKVDQLLADCWLNFQGNSGYDSEQAKITHCLSYMKEGGGTAMWANNVVLALQKGSGEGCYTTWESFKEAVISDFKGGAQVEIAQAKIEALYQGNATATMFFMVLDTLNQAAGFDTVSIIRQVKKGLDQKVLQAIYMQPALPTDYVGWKSAAINHDGMHRAYATVNLFGTPNQNAGFGKKPEFSKMVPAIQAPLVGVTTGGGQATSVPAAAGPSTAPVPMDINRATSQPTANRNKPVCFACGKEGHIQRNCPIYLAKNPQF
ncbi:hypothetical protein C8J57DRAFT_1247613 [Mycena rebaudengoi]|nr:hypothetical protein C8J57DRAFT_1247613 [Mycena rebaudengoi]